MYNNYKKSAVAACVLLSLSLPAWAGTAGNLDSSMSVTAERVPVLINQSISATTVITADEMRARGVESVADALRLVPGVTILRSGEFGAASYARINGANANQVLVLVNGQRVTTSAFITGTDLSRFTLEDVVRIEVVRGALSSLYGSDAIGGVINIITDQSKKSKSEAVLAVGSNGRSMRSVSVSGNTGVGWRLNVGSPRFDGSIVNSEYKADHISSEISLPSLKGWDVTLHQSNYDDHLGLPGPAQRYNLTTGFGIYDTDDHQTAKRSDYGVSVSRGLGSGMLGIRSYRIEDDLHRLLDGANGNLDSNVTARTEASDFSWRYTNMRHDVVFGGEVRKETYVDNETTVPSISNKDITTRAFYAQDRWILDPNTHLVFGTRFDDHSVAGNINSPRVGLVRAFEGGKLKLRATYSEGFRAPGFVELYYTGSMGVGNPNLSPEKTRQYALALSSIEKDDSIDLTAFDSSVRNEIVWVTDPITSLGTFENVERSRQRGLELAWSHKVSPTGIFTISYAFLDARDRTTGDTLPGVPRRQLNMSAGGRAGMWNILLLGRWNDGWIESGNRIQGKPVFDLSFQRVGEGLLRPYVMLRNLTNAKYQELPGYFAEGAGIEAGVRSTW